MSARKRNTLGRKRKRTSLPQKSLISKGHFPIRTLIFWGIKLGLFGFFLLIILFALVYAGTFGQLPDSAALIKIKEPVASEVYSKDNKLLGRYYVENRSNVKFKEISPNVINALVATEDVRFYEHRGIDEWALLRVVVKTIFMVDRSAGGGSTLSQQVVKNIFGRKNYGPLTIPISKIRESIIAYRLEKLYSKEEILTLYLNTVPFGENTYGIETAAERFFSTTPAKLTVSQAATLVGLLKANNYYNPHKNPERSLQRRNVVISQMLKYKYITSQQAAKYMKEPLGLKYNYLVYNTGLAAYFRELIRPQLEEWCLGNNKPDGTPYNLYTDGLKIITTIDSRMQKYAELSMQERMKELQATFEKHWQGKYPWGKNTQILERAMKRSDRYKRMKEAGKSQTEIAEAFRKPLSMKLFSWTGEKSVNISPMDSIKYMLTLLHCGFIAIEPETGDIKAWIGGDDFRYFQYDHVLSRRQVGSAFKPIVYASALEQGLPPDKYYANQKITYPEYQNWSPSNSDDQYGGYYSLEGALCKSVNTVSVQVLVESGIPEAVRLAKAMGIDADLPEVPSLALGVADISLLDMAKAYCCLDNQGKIVAPNYILRIEDGNGKILKKFVPSDDQKEVLSPENARIITHFLKSVVNEGTGSEIRSLYKVQGDFAGKTGTTQNYADGWFMGYTPDLVTGCWVGGEEPSIHFRNIALGRGGYTALPIVGKFFNKLYRDPGFRDYQFHTFPEPDERALAMLDTPHYKEVLREKGIFNLWGLFNSKQKEKSERNTDQSKVQQKKAPVSPDVNKEEKNKPTIWQKIRDALRKR